jgi:RNA polymerase sigma-70 factor (ECF subfamily)
MGESIAMFRSANDLESRSLIVLAREGDHEAFGALCAQHEARLLRYALALCADLPVAEELAQDTFIAAWKSLRRFNGRCAFLTWLCSILIHLHQNRLRQTRRSAGKLARLVQDGHDSTGPLIDPGQRPDEALALSEQARILRECLEKLPRRHREVVLLRFYAQESLEGIAAALNCSVGTVKSRLFHALDKLRKMRRLGHDPWQTDKII